MSSLIPSLLPQSRLQYVLETGQKLMSRARPAQRLTVTSETLTAQTEKTSTVRPTMTDSIGTAYTRFGGPDRERIAAAEAKVLQYMPKLEELKIACMAVHQVYLYVEKFSDVSDVWTLNWEADEVYIPHNHFDALNFMSSNEEMITQANEMVTQLESKLQARTLTPEEEIFIKAWLVAKQMLSRIDQLNKNAPYWSDMRKEYGEFATPRAQ